MLLPAVGLHEYDREPLPEYANGTGWEELFDLSLESESRVKALQRPRSCSRPH